jgi:GNAT superfamily N-acetyltransferase
MACRAGRLDFGMTPSPSEVLVRRAEARDVAALGELGAALMRTHYAFDPQRFIAPGDGHEASEGYADFLGSQLDGDGVIVLVAERESRIIGYVYAGIEPLSWKELRDECGFVHDLLVTEEARGTGVGEALLDRAIGWLREQGMPRVVLWTSTHNAGARRLFERRAFRPTMLEMTLEL